MDKPETQQLFQGIPLPVKKQLFDLRQAQQMGLKVLYAMEDVVFMMSMSITNVMMATMGRLAVEVNQSVFEVV